MKRLVYLGALVALLVASLSVGSVAGAQEVTGGIPEPVPGGTTPVEETTEVTGSIPEPVPGGTTPVEGPVTDPNDVTALPDTGGSVIAVACVAGVFLLASGLVVRRIIK